MQLSVDGSMQIACLKEDGHRGLRTLIQDCRGGVWHWPFGEARGRYCVSHLCRLPTTSAPPAACELPVLNHATPARTLQALRPGRAGAPPPATGPARGPTRSGRPRIRRSVACVSRPAVRTAGGILDHDGLVLLAAREKKHAPKGVSIQSPRVMPFLPSHPRASTNKPGSIA